MFGNLGEMAKMIQKAKDIQKNIGAIKEELKNAEYTALSQCKLVSATVSGDFEVKKIDIQQLGETPEQTSEMVRSAVNNALFAARQAAQDKMKEITGGIDIPGLS